MFSRCMLCLLTPVAKESQASERSTGPVACMTVVDRCRGFPVELHTSFAGRRASDNEDARCLVTLESQGSSVAERRW